MPEKPNNTEEKPIVNEEVTRVLEDLRQAAEKINKTGDEKPAPVVNQTAERRAALQKTLGFNDDQMAAHEEMIMRSQAPIIERTAWTSIEKKSDIEEYRSDMEKELSIYPQERRTPELVLKVYHMLKGQKADSKPVAKTPGDGRVTETRVTRGPGYNPGEPGMGAPSKEDGGANEDDQLSDQEKFVAAKLGVTEKEYADSRKVGKSIRELKIPDSRPVTSLADVELRRLTGKR